MVNMNCRCLSEGNENFKVVDEDPKIALIRRLQGLYLPTILKGVLCLFLERFGTIKSKITSDWQSHTFKFL